MYTVLTTTETRSPSALEMEFLYDVRFRQTGVQYLENVIGLRIGVAISNRAMSGDWHGNNYVATFAKQSHRVKHAEPGMLLAVQDHTTGKWTVGTISELSHRAD